MFYLFLQLLLTCKLAHSVTVTCDYPENEWVTMGVVALSTEDINLDAYTPSTTMLCLPVCVYPSERLIDGTCNTINLQFNQMGCLIRPIIDVQKCDNFGYSVSLSADGLRVAIGSPKNSGLQNNKAYGNVRIFQWKFDDFWEQLGGDIDGNAQVEERSGFSVSLSADGLRVAIGAPGGDTVRLYEYKDNLWTKLGQDFVHEGASGYFVCLDEDGDRVAIGAPFDVSDAGTEGVVRVYE
jgi:hypothetical protein